VLGLEPGAEAAEIRAAYRRLAAQYHPDKVAHLGAEFQRLAEQKFKTIQAAYEQLQSRF
jgi:DnaJ-class molecular chaperone